MQGGMFDAAAAQDLGRAMVWGKAAGRWAKDHGVLVEEALKERDEVA